MTDPRTIPKFSTRLWSEEVGLAEAGELQHQDIGYRFSGGRTFAASKYDPLPPPELPPEDQP